MNVFIKGGYGKKDPPSGLKRSKYTLDPVGLKVEDFAEDMIVLPVTKEC